MTTRRSSTQPLLLLTLALTTAGAVSGAVGCGSDSLSFCVETSKAFCQVQYQCCTAAERSVSFGQLDNAIGPFHDEGGCVDAFTRQCEASSQAQDESIALKRLTFDKKKADKCVDNRRKAAAECDADAIFNPDPDCAQIVTGNVGDGDKCTTDTECKELGSQCEIDRTPDDNGNVTITIEGECKGQGDAGEPCFFNGLCNEGLRCVQLPPNFEQVCEPPAGAGGVCNNDDDCAEGLRCTEDANFELRCTQPGDVGAVCDVDTDCTEGLRCLENEVSQRQCTVPGVAGTQCFSSADCGSGLLCVFDNNDELCEAPAAAGEECPGGTQQCLPGLDCRFDGTTNRCFGGGEGDACDRFNSSQRCALGFSCRQDPIAGRDRCLPPLILNASCDEFQAKQCVSPLVCRENASFQAICQSPLAANAPCNTTSSGQDDPCDATHHCAFDSGASDDICVPRLTAGETCFSQFECTNGTFCSSGDVCTALLGVGAGCNDSTECQANLTCRPNDVGSQNICRAVSAEGQVCSQTNDCAPNLDCRVDDAGARNICRGASGEDGRCIDVADCASGLDCRTDEDGSSLVCRGLSQNGERCDNALDCDPGLECRFDNNTGQQRCLGKAAEGEACSSDDDCDDALVCRTDPETFAQLCRTLGVEGDTCQQDNDCGGGLRCRDIGEVDGVVVCTDKQDNGGPCLSDDDCVNGTCDVNNNFCGEAQPEQSFDICNGL